LNCTSNASNLIRSILACEPKEVAGIGRVLLSLTAILLITTPLTQYIWTWDHFLRGGQDYELSTLIVLAFFCLVPVLAQHCKQSIDLLFAAPGQTSFLSGASLAATIAPPGPFSTLHAESKASPGLEKLSFPLQI
jgi:hypothetical protein